MSKSKKNDVDYFEGLGWDADLDETTCTPETLAYLNRPDNERHLDFEQWLPLYEQQKKDAENS